MGENVRISHLGQHAMQVARKVPKKLPEGMQCFHPTLQNHTMLPPAKTIGTTVYERRGCVTRGGEDVVVCVVVCVVVYIMLCIES